MTFAKDFLILPNGCDLYTQNAATQGLGIINLRKITVLRDILVSIATVEVTTQVANSFFGIGLYDPISLSAVVKFDGFSGVGVGSKTVYLKNPIIIPAGVYWLAWGADVAGAIFLRGTASDNIFQNTRLNGETPSRVTTGGIMPLSLVKILNSTLSSSCVLVVLQ